MDFDHIEEWLTWLRDVRHLRGGTLVSYGSTLNAFAQWCTADDWSAVTATDVEQFMNRPRRRGVIGAAATQDRDRIAIAQFYKWLRARGVTTVDPNENVGVPKVRNRMPRAVPDHIWERVWQSELPDDDRLWLGLGGIVGLRRREIVTIAPEQVDPARGLLLYLERKGGKEDAIEYEQCAHILADGLPRVLPSAEVWLDIVARHASMRRGSRALVSIGKEATQIERFQHTLPVGVAAPGAVNDALEKVLIRADIPKVDWFSPHALRHMFVTNLLRCGVPIEVVSDVAGHSAIDTTRRYVKSAGRLADWRDRFAHKESSGGSRPPHPALAGR
jgi:integrase/recombinase XerD